ncbi:unnamed protein product [Penicillium olsonii]|uniref:Flavin prenyltransferase PAD1, mitochondrial n=1 Tax=Penicillium olsonii TaxID=99116 RepID=A0A9W4HEZ0_PENOL|nr:unnamed protein product [Penicillium olsonii]
MFLQFSASLADSFTYLVPHAVDSFQIYRPDLGNIEHHRWDIFVPQLGYTCGVYWGPFNTFTREFHLIPGLSLLFFAMDIFKSRSDPPSTAVSHIQQPPRRRRIIVALTGATGSILGVKTLIALRQLNVETHLVISKWAEATIKYETDYTIPNIRALADHVYNIHDMAAPIASGSFRVDGMIIVPCSVKTLASISSGICDDLISRAADVILKERRRLVLAVRETPLSSIHLRNMTTVTEAGAIIFPPVPAYYIKPSSIDDLVDHSVGRMLDLFDLDTEAFERWGGFKKD